MENEYSIQILRNFVRVSQLKNITWASNELYITQPTLSRQITQLEKNVGVPLFVRHKTGVELTETGKKVYKYAVKLIEACDDFSCRMHGLQSEVSGRLIFAHQKSSQEISLAINGVLKKQYPNVLIHNSEFIYGNLLDELRNETYSAVFVYRDEVTKRHKGISCMHLGNLRNMLLVAKGNQLSKQESVSLKDLARQRFVIGNRSNSPFRYEEVYAACEEAGFIPDVVATAESILTTISAIVMNDAVGILPYIHNVEEGEMVKYISIEGFREDYPVGLAWRESDDNPALKAYLQFIHSLRDRFTNSGEEYLYSKEKSNLAVFLKDSGM